MPISARWWAANREGQGRYLSSRMMWANRYSPTVIAAAITSRLDKNRMPTHIGIKGPAAGLAKDSVVLLEQMRTLDKRRLREKTGRIDPADQRRVDEAINVSLGLHQF